MDVGSFFGQNKGLYWLEFNHLSLPASAQQHNRKSRYGRCVRRSMLKGKGGDADNSDNKEVSFFERQNKHFLYMKYYLPLSLEDFQVIIYG